MTQYSSINTKLSNSQLSKLKSAIKNETDIILRLSPNMIGESNHKTNFPQNYYYQKDKFLVFVRFSLIIHQSILNFQKLNYQK